MFLFIYARKHACTYVYIHICKYICMYVGIHVCMNARSYYVCTYVCKYEYIANVRTNVCIYVIIMSRPQISTTFAYR